MISDSEHLLMCISVICISLENCLLRSFICFSIFFFTLWHKWKLITFIGGIKVKQRRLLKVKGKLARSSSCLRPLLATPKAEDVSTLVNVYPIQDTQLGISALIRCNIQVRRRSQEPQPWQIWRNVALRRGRDNRVVKGGDTKSSSRRFSYHSCFKILHCWF